MTDLLSQMYGSKTKMKFTTRLLALFAIPIAMFFLAACSSEDSDHQVSAIANTNDKIVPLPNTPLPNSHILIKNANLHLEVEDAGKAFDESVKIVNDMGGHIIDSHLGTQDINGAKYQYGIITISVPAGQFETAMLRLCELDGSRLLDEHVSSRDVATSQSELANLEATRVPFLIFIKNAKTTQESMEMNLGLWGIETQIAEIKGRIDASLAGNSIITISLEPKPSPPLTPAPSATPTRTRTSTSTPTSTPTPTPTLQRLIKKLDSAVNTIANTYENIIEALISPLAMCVAFVFPLLVVILAIWAIWKFIVRRVIK